MTDNNWKKTVKDSAGGFHQLGHLSLIWVSHYVFTLRIPNVLKIPMSGGRDGNEKNPLKTKWKCEELPPFMVKNFSFLTCHIWKLTRLCFTKENWVRNAEIHSREVRKYRLKKNQKWLIYYDLKTHFIITLHKVFFHLPRQTFRHSVYRSVSTAPSITSFLG